MDEIITWIIFPVILKKGSTTLSIFISVFICSTWYDWIRKKKKNELQGNAHDKQTPKLDQF